MTDDPDSRLTDTQLYPKALRPFREEALLTSGSVVGRRWRLERFLDGGGMGSVWQASDLRLDEQAAVKLLNPHLVSGEESRRRFMNEARAAAQLRGPNVVSVLDFDIDEGSGVPYMAMELLRGEDLAARLRRGPLGYLQTRTMLTDVVRAISRAHRRGIIHRDLKPANIFLTRTDEGIVAKVLDFGIAKLQYLNDGKPSITAPHRALGTPHYMSPEQISDAKTVDARADIWSLAVIVYECMVGELAFPGEAAVQVIRKICLDAPLPPSSHRAVPPGFDTWFAQGTKTHPNERFGSVEALLFAFESLEAGTSAPAPVPEKVEPRKTRSRAWVSDANQVEIESLDEVVFKTTIVKEFIDEDRRYFISGAKGCGKTLLLTCKRALLSERYQNEKKAAVTFIPEGRPYLDLMTDLRTVGRSTQELMANLGHAKRLWGFALRMSAISYELAGQLPSAVMAALPPRLKTVADGLKAEPTVVVREVLALTVSQIHQLFDVAELALEQGIRSIHSGIYFFIDKLDQALRGVSRDAWISMQAGLVEAAWDLMNTNAHVKVYVTVREEAFSAYESDIKANLFGATTRIRYSKRELQSMLERLSDFYEGVPLQEFVSLDMVSSPDRSGEAVFDYLYRHTLGRPRDFVIVASELSRRQGELGERTFKSVVQETCSQILVSNVFDEMRVFLEVLDGRQERARFLAKIPFGVLFHEDLVDAWCAFHGVEKAYFEDYARDSDDVFHPFRELYDCGLLGAVTTDPVTEEKVQRFKQPHDPLDAIRFELPRSEVYLLHPSLHALMRRLGFHDGYRVMRDVQIGHDLPWPPLDQVLVTIQRQLFLRGEPEGGAVANGVRDLLDRLRRSVQTGAALQDALSQVSSLPAFTDLCARVDELGWDDLHLALLETFSEN